VFLIDSYFDFEIYLWPVLLMQAKNKTRRSNPLTSSRGLKIKHDIVAGLEAELLRRVRADESMSRVELARRLNLAPSTVSIYVDRLIAEGFLLETEKVERAFGRPPKALRLNAQGGRFIGIDFEARNIMATAVDFSQKPLSQCRQSIQASDSVETVLKKIENAIHEVAADDERRILGIGIGVPGAIDHKAGVALHYRHIRGWDNIPLAEKMSRRFHAPVFLENNIRSMALAELWFGQGRGIEHFICVGVRSGIGAGIITDGHLYRGANNVAGEIADWPCAPAGFAGNRKSQEVARLEDLVSQRTIRNGELEDAVRAFAAVLSQLNLAFNPAKIILAGAITKLGDDFLARLRNQIAQFSNSPEVPNIVNSTLGDFNGALGAAALAVHQWKPVRK
jgi:N-acetylglucosamine repressor